MDIGGQPDFDRTYDSKTGCGEHLEPIDQSQPSLTIYHTNDETLEGSRCTGLPESIQTFSILV